MNSTDRLSDAEASFVRRYCWEVVNHHFGPGSIFDQCRDHCRDLEFLAAASNIQGEVLDDYLDSQPAPPAVTFPWQSFEALHARAQESGWARNR